MCQIFSEDEDRLDALLKFLSSGLEAGERTACFTQKLDQDQLTKQLAGKGFPCKKLAESGAFSMAENREAYFPDGRFDPDRMLELLRRFHEASVAGGFTAARVIGEMSEIKFRPSGIQVGKMRCLLYTSPSPRDRTRSRMPSSA